ncbi:uncharacterized protein Z519_05700 [Cladophialophora bantiana CBS 173.52]|uniref:Alpha/beta hydrolase fold-3 domain-containing protein n=1 Tax=Cladophialophora bantiana (strain ATCC 10958 / CBS 173.52 / CDC B-1940 / NIH 8579) TaxID=1442370 RepID=A0A0D2HQJ9_CLAB1|nr:uncharacterized protein Z519_05700 [Cladophialophora bantiana CBS 173.52]KIW93095.1 hypothetical protein Z519_05700 [Cladophialophora bantiana CBS 173.52]
MDGNRLSRCILYIMLSWIFCDECTFELCHRATFRALPTTAVEAEQIQRFLNERFAGRAVSWTQVCQQMDHLRELVTSRQNVQSHTHPWTRHFNWLMNAAILYVGAVAQPVTRAFLEPRALPVNAMLRFLSRRFHVQLTVQDLEHHITRWVIVLCGSAGEVQENLPPTAARVGQTMAKYLAVPLSPLAPNISTQLCDQYRQFHEEVVQWYPPRVWGNRITPMSPYEASTDIPPNLDVYTQDHTPAGLIVRQFVPEEHKQHDMPVVVWFAGGGWMLGDIEGDNNVLSHISAIFSGEYRRKPFPTPHNDALEIANWVRHEVGERDVILAGVSSGGNLAAATALQWAAAKRPPAGLLLVAPSLDNSTDCEQRWQRNWDAPWLTPETMRFFQDRCFQGPGERSTANWRASPIYASQQMIDAARAFPTKVVAMGGDILFQESVDFVARLRLAGCDTALSVFPYGHTGLLMQGIVGTALIEEMIYWIKQRARRSPMDEAA